MNCKKCSQEISENSKFCSFCGEIQNGESRNNNLIEESKAEESKSLTEVDKVENDNKEDLVADEVIEDTKKPETKAKNKKGKIIAGTIVLMCGAVITYNMVTISNGDIDKALDSMKTTKIIKILDKIENDQIPYFEKTAKESFKKYLKSLGYDYNKEMWIEETDANFINDLSAKLSFLENERLTKVGMMYDIKIQCDQIVAANKLSEEIDFELADKFYNLEEKSGYVTHRVENKEAEGEYLDLYYVSPEYYADEEFVIQETEEGVISRDYIEGSFIYLRDEEFYQDGFSVVLPVYEYITEDEVAKITSEYNKIEQNTPAMVEELAILITEFINS